LFLSLFSYITALPVLPLQLNGSNTVQPLGVTSLTKYCISSVGFTVGCIFFLGAQLHAKAFQLEYLPFQLAQSLFSSLFNNSFAHFSSNSSNHSSLSLLLAFAQ
jgi:hypothetical protein